MDVRFYFKDSKYYLKKKLFREFSPILLLTGYEVTHVVIFNLWFGFSDIKHPSITLFDGIH